MATAGRRHQARTADGSSLRGGAKYVAQPQQRDVEKEAEGAFDARSQWPPEARDKLIEDHPITRRRYTVPTPMLKSAYVVTRERVYSRRTGLVFFGETRAGKTTCALSIKDYLEEEFPNVYVTLATARHTNRPVDGHVYRLILEGSGHVCAKRNDPNLLLRNVVADVQICTNQRHGDQYVLIIDEVNLLNEADLSNLLELHNALNLLDIRMTTVSFGQPEILDRISSLLAQEKKQIVARFFRAPKPFHMCDSASSLNELLSYLDEKTEWPDGSGCTYTQFFFPLAYRSGFRMSKYTQNIWTALDTACSGSHEGCTMEIVALAVEWLYLAMWRDDSSDFSLTDDDIAAALEAADVM